MRPAPVRDLLDDVLDLQDGCLLDPPDEEDET